jgi:hypothetical protein
MKGKVKKPRVAYFGYLLFNTKCAKYIQPVPFDSKKRPILSSVNTFFNEEYYSIRDAVSTLVAI